MEDVCSRIVSRMMKRAVARAFYTWCDHSNEQRRMEDVCSRMLSRMMNRSLSAAFDNWLLHLSEAHFANVVEYCCHKVVLRSLQRKMTKVFCIWTETSITSRISRQRLRKAVFVWNLNAGKKAFQSWRETIESQKRLRRTEGHATRRLMTKTVHKNWLYWSTVAIRQRQARHGVARFVARIGHKIESQSMARWAFNNKVLQLHRKLLYKALWIIRNRLLHKAWCAWQVVEALTAL